MKKIWKFAIPKPALAIHNIGMPVGAQILSCGLDGVGENAGGWALWAVVDVSDAGWKSNLRRIAVVNTGGEWPRGMVRTESPGIGQFDGVFVGTIFDGPFRWHVFDLGAA